MAVPRDNPYGAFNFVVTADPINGGDGASLKGGFQEISGLNIEVTVAEYRNGNERVNSSRRIPGRPSYPPASPSEAVVEPCSTTG